MSICTLLFFCNIRFDYHFVVEEETPFGARGKNRGGFMSGSDPVFVRPMILPPPPTGFPS